MLRRTLRVLAVAACCLLMSPLATAIEPNLEIKLWPDGPPAAAGRGGRGRAGGRGFGGGARGARGGGDTGVKVPTPEVKLAEGEQIVNLSQGRQRPFWQITNVTDPTVSIFLPEQDKRNGAAVLVLPGGGLQRLAYEHEGLELAEWLVDNGVAAFVVKYRVPASANIGLQDAQRAMSIVRTRAPEWKVDPNAIGTAGFSAGAEIVAGLATRFTDGDRTYEPIDDSDEASTRPDFAVMAYTGTGVNQNISSRFGPETPPFFFVQASDDNSALTLQFALALRQAGIPSEVHVYQLGTHGFGVRPGKEPVTTWNDRLLAWLQVQGFLDKASLREYERRFVAAIRSEDKTTPLPRLTTIDAQATLEDAFVAQRRIFRDLSVGDGILGFKGGYSSADSQQKNDLSGPVNGIMLRSSWIEASTRPVISLSENPGLMIETEIGYVVSVDTAINVNNDVQGFGMQKNIFPVIEMPINYASRMGVDEISLIDNVAANLGATGKVIASRSQYVPYNGVDPNELTVTLKKDGVVLHQVNAGEAVNGGQWHNLRGIVNQVVAGGQTLKENMIIISGSLAAPRPAEPGVYEADYGALGKIEFEIRP